MRKKVVYYSLFDGDKCHRKKISGKGEGKGTAERAGYLQEERCSHGNSQAKGPRWV